MNHHAASRRSVLGALLLAPLACGHALAQTAQSGPPVIRQPPASSRAALLERRLGTGDLSDCDMYSSATPCPICQGALYWAGIRHIHTDGAPEQGVAPKLGC